MNIGLVSEYFPPFTIGGGEWSTYYLARALAESGHKTVIITPNYGATNYEEREGLRIYRYWFPQKLRHGQEAKTLFLLNPINYINAAFAIWNVAKKEKLSILHAQNTYSIVPAYLAARMSNIAFVVTLRDFMSICTAGLLCLRDNPRTPSRCSLLKYTNCLVEFWRYFNPCGIRYKKMKYILDGLYRRFDLSIRRFCLKRADSLITVSKAIYNTYNENLKTPKSQKMHVVYNLPPQFDLSQCSNEEIRRKYDLPPDKKIVLFAGRLSPAKGIETLSEAIPKVRDKHPEVLFVLAGRSSESNISLLLENDGSVRKIGNLPYMELLNLMAISYAVVIPSEWPEPLPRVALEAMSLGKPIVATKVGGITEVVIDGVNGFLVDKKDSDALAGDIVRLIADEAKAEQMGLAGRNLLQQRYPKVESISEQILQIYRS